MAYFPMFVQLENKACLVVGGGHIAYHKVMVLRDFGARVEVVAKEIELELRNMAEKDENVVCRERVFDAADIVGKELVVAATDSGEINHYIGQLCREKKIPFNAVDQPEDCDFIFPSYVRHGDLVGAFSSGGKSPAMTQYLKKEMQPILTSFLGELNEILGDVRDEVKDVIAESKRSRFYREFLNYCIDKQCIPNEAEIKEWLERKQYHDEKNAQIEKE